MGSNPFRAPEFLRLFQEWNERLKKDGFIDAEDFSLPDPPLKVWHSLKWENGSAAKREIDAKNYYELASELLYNGFRFKNDVYRRTWELHCAGLSVRNIEKALQSQLIGYKGRTKTRVHFVILSIQRASGLKNE